MDGKIWFESMKYVLLVVEAWRDLKKKVRLKLKRDTTRVRRDQPRCHSAASGGAQRNVDLGVWLHWRYSKFCQNLFRSHKNQNLPFCITLAIGIYNNLYTSVQVTIT